MEGSLLLLLLLPPTTTRRARRLQCVRSRTATLGYKAATVLPVQYTVQYTVYIRTGLYVGGALANASRFQVIASYFENVYEDK